MGTISDIIIYGSDVCPRLNVWRNHDRWFWVWTHIQHIHMTGLLLPSAKLASRDFIWSHRLLYLYNTGIDMEHHIHSSSQYCLYHLICLMEKSIVLCLWWNYYWQAANSGFSDQSSPRSARLGCTIVHSNFWRITILFRFFATTIISVSSFDFIKFQWTILYNRYIIL